MTLSINSKITLNNGISMPLFGLGVFLAGQGKEAYSAVNHALDIGYRLIDTAAYYKNEADIGRAVKDSSVPREDIFVTTKVWNDDHGYDQTLKAFNKSLSKLGLDYIDLYLIHWPVQGKRLETWKALEKLYEEGKVRSIGVSNYMIHHLDELFESSSTIPAVNQVEFSPYLYLNDLLDYCVDKKIQLEAYSPLTRTRKFNDPPLVNIAQKHSKTPAQILIRWALEHNVVVIPKSANKERISENANVFDFVLDKDDMSVLDNIHENFRVSWDPSQFP